ncbi:hypothetical protein ENSA5_43610 [Enhygromyxa salina]|uniref:RelA/SpoT domain-containing protein n=1 Tax=Enhygromyxa salina TaxID=215803 RepID=A0A2S9XK58_9BACT|nr:hypothetical protein [Enhygromyxa salina]PRP93266.1 hypothetical protein ENSA5_43610 [Enhygromyxa salina]
MSNGDRSLVTDAEIERVVRLYRQMLPRFEEAARHVESQLRRELRSMAVRGLLSSRAKHPQDVADKIRRKRERGDPRYTFARLGDDLNEVITDLAGARVVVYHPKDEERVFETIRRSFAIADVENAVEVKLADTYRARHVLVAIDESAERESLRGTYVEVQISSISSHVFNELEHDIAYKDKGVTPTDKVRECLEQVLHASRLLDRAVEHLLEARHESVVSAGRLLENAEDLRYALEQHAGRWLSGDFEQLFRLLRPVVDNLTATNLIALFSDIPALLDEGARRARATGGDFDHVACLALSIIDQFGTDFEDVVASWEPTSALKRAIMEFKTDA